MGGVWRRGWAGVCMVLVQVFTTGMMVLSKIVISRGMFVYALVSYRTIIGAFFVAPFAFYFERDLWRKIGWKQMMWISINACLGQTLALGLYYYGLGQSNPSYALDFLNMVPIVTYIFSLFIRMEKLDLGRRHGLAKLLGCLICVGGTMVITLYKGNVIHLWPSKDHINQTHLIPKTPSMSNIKLGTAFLISSIICYALWFMSQVKLLQVFPSNYWPTLTTCLVGSIQAAIVGVIIDRKQSSWRLNWDLDLLTIFYSGILNTGLTYLLINWVVKKKGPIYPSMFNTLSLVFTTIIEVLFMGHNLTTSGIIGMIMIIGGLYGFLWGKKKEMEKRKVASDHVEDISTEMGSVQILAFGGCDSSITTEIHKGEHDKNTSVVVPTSP